MAALGRLEPAGGIVKVALPSTPEAVSGAVITRLYVERGDDVKAGQLLAESDTIAVLNAALAESRAGLETAKAAGIPVFGMDAGASPLLVTTVTSNGYAMAADTAALGVVWRDLDSLSLDQALCITGLDEAGLR